MTERPALDRWLADADELVRGGDDNLADGMRCRPAGAEESQRTEDVVRDWFALSRAWLTREPAFLRSAPDGNPDTDTVARTRLVVHHVDGNGHNNDPANLRVISAQENSRLGGRSETFDQWHERRYCSGL
jgi:hypothetical protein